MRPRQQRFPSPAFQKGFTPLHVAAKYGSLDVAKLLLQRHASADAAGKVRGSAARGRGVCSVRARHGRAGTCGCGAGVTRMGRCSLPAGGWARDPPPAGHLQGWLSPVSLDSVTLRDCLTNVASVHVHPRVGSPRLTVPAALCRTA